MTVHIRVATPADAEACGRIIFEAFQSVAEHHGFSPDFPIVETATQLAQSFIAHPSIFGVVAEEDGRVIGSNFLAEGDAIRGIGPITIEPRLQGGGVGRRPSACVVRATALMPRSSCGSASRSAPSLCPGISMMR